ncbi:MAG: type II toxin-antitoxin system HicA family toxin [Ignavibacteriae bacterium]|nr:type II toxin-antitoxin system HicA family toxin [Ignavibacteriota bacterium]
MSKQLRLTAKEAEKILYDAGFELLRVKGSHHIYIKNSVRIVLPFHGVKILHPKIVKQVLEAVAKVQNY